MKREIKKKVDFVVKWLLVLFSSLDFILTTCFVFIEKEIDPQFPPIYDIRYYYWFLALTLVSLCVCLYGTFVEDYLWLWSGGTMMFIVLFVGITGEASNLLLAPFSFIMLMVFVYGYMVRYRPRNASEHDEFV